MASAEEKDKDKVVRRVVMIAHPGGLHVRPASEVARVARGFQGVQVTVSRGETSADARDVMSLLMLVADFGTEVEIAARGPGADAALAEIVRILTSSRPHEDDSHPPSAV
jgi:phosphotransferase system HPr (HPr) family protein